jgi:hypothetical protein
MLYSRILLELPLTGIELPIASIPKPPRKKVEKKFQTPSLKGQNSADHGRDA